MQIISNYFEHHDLKWEKLVGFYMDGAPAMLGYCLGLAILIKKTNSSALTSHCVIHFQALATKTLLEELVIVMKLAIKLMKFVKRKAYIRIWEIFLRYLLVFFITYLFK